ncbi:MAG: S8 family serine peptidase, partial [Thermoguttaceae bacterium]|nr:S8 family serine peptidase [Thermoguttaceae bacterium]
MGIWESFRGLTTRSARATQQGAKSRRGRLKKHTRPRDLRVEQFEARVLLSINPVAEDDVLWNRTLTGALDAAADLSRYSADTLVQTDQWVVALAPGDSSDYRAAAAGAQSLGRAGALPDNFYIWQFSSYVNGIEAAQRLAASENVAMFYPLVPISVESAATPNDDLFRDQWNLRSIVQTGPAPSMNVTTAWDLTTLDGTPIRGNGVVIGIVDDGLESTHGDLSANVLNALGRDFNDNDFDPSPGAGNNHGTAVAGVAAARQNNSTGISGVASGASLAGIRLTAAAPTDTLIAQALAHANGQIAIYNNSWVTVQDFQTLPSTLAALNNIGSGTAAAGRGGLGSIVVNAAGNSAYTGQRTDYQLLTSDRHVITVGAVGADGKPATYYDQASSTVRRYSEPGASLFVSAYSGSYVGMEWKGLVTTDRSLDNGYNTSGTDTDIFGQTLEDMNATPGFNTNFTSTFGGTSAAAATVSGIIAMMLEANPNLTYRDVQHILVQSARQNDFASEEWVTTGGGHAVHHDYGFGVVDARKAVELASTWKTVRAELSQTTGLITLNRALPDNDLTGIVDTVTLQNQINKIEWAELTIDFGSGHADAGDLEIILTSPLGTEAVFSQPRADAAGPLGRWTFSTPRFWDEASGGDWTLTIRDRQTGQTGTLASWELRVRGVANVSGPDLSAVIPNAGSVIIPGSDIDPFRIAPRELLLRFNEGQQIDPASFAPDTIPAGQKSIQIINKATGRPVEFGYINIGDRANEVIVRFAESLPDGDYQLKIFGTGSNPLKNKATPIAEVFRLGEDLTLDFTLDLGPQVISVVPQPISRGTSGLTQARDKIEVYFDQQLDPATATNRLFYQLIATQETATPDDDVVILPSVTPDGVVYDPVAKKVTLKFDDDLANLVTDPLKKKTGAFRLRIGNAYEKVTTTPITVGEAGENFYTAENLSTSFGQSSGPHSVILTAEILASHATPYNLEWPGAVDEPGHRDLPANMGIEDHLDGDSAPDGVHGITNFTYSFPDIIGTDSSSGAPLYNLITAAQKQRAREIFSIYANYLGVTFTEVPSGGMRIATGDLKVFPRLTSAPGGVGGVAGGGMAVMDYAENWGASEFGGSWFQVAL